MAKTYKEQVKDLKVALKESEEGRDFWRDKAQELGKEVQKYKRSEEIKTSRVQAATSTKLGYLEEENRKLWYMVRHLTNDNRVQTKRMDWQNGCEKEVTVDPFFLGPNY